MVVSVRESSPSRVLLETCHPEARFRLKDLPEYLRHNFRVQALTPIVFALVICVMFLSHMLSASESSNFHVKDRSKASRGFGAVAHYQDLFWKSKRIAKEVGQVFVSPSKRFALFVQNGGLFVADENRQQVCVVAGGYIGIPDYVVWTEPNLKASLGYRDHHLPTTIDLFDVNSHCRKFQ